MDGEERTWRVEELGDRLAAAVTRAFPRQLWVRGEVQSHRPPRRGHEFFDLVDPEATGGGRPRLSVVLLARNRALLRHDLAGHPEVELRDGLEVRVRGALRYHAPTGRLQLEMTGIDPVFTLGALAADRDRVLRALAAEGLLGRNRELALTPVPLRVGVVTSIGSAAHRDFLRELESSGLAWHVVVHDCQVQGARAATAVGAAVHRLAARGVDLVAVVRGGGARTDLAVFDEEALARAVATAPVPVITGIGHEVDTSVVDHVAHRAFTTPTACARALVERVRRHQRRAEEAWAATGRAATRCLERADGRAERLTERLATAARFRLDRATQRLEVDAARLAAVDPVRALERGFSVTRTTDGRVVRRVADAPPGAELVTTLADGTVTSRVLGDGGPDR